MFDVVIAIVGFTGTFDTAIRMMRSLFAFRSLISVLEKKLILLNLILIQFINQSSNKSLEQSNTKL